MATCPRTSASYSLKKTSSSRLTKNSTRKEITDQKNEDNQLDGFDQVTDDNDLHDLILVNEDILSQLRIFHNFVKFIIIKPLHMFHDFSCIQNCKCFFEPIAL